jgi:hypothetical protein
MTSQLDREQLASLREKFNVARDSGDTARVAEYCEELSIAYEKAGMKGEARRFYLISSFAKVQLSENVQKIQTRNEIQGSGISLKIRIPDFPLTGVLQFLGERTGLVKVILNEGTQKRFQMASLYLENGMLLKCALDGPHGPVGNEDLQELLCEVLRLDLEEEKGEVTFSSLDLEEARSVEGRIPSDKAKPLAGMIFEGFTAIDENDRDSGDEAWT